MLGAGFIGATRMRHARQRNATGPAAITAVRRPATSVLVVGDTLSDTADWAAFLNPANYSSTAGTIDTVTVNFIGSAPDASTAFTDGQTNYFSITVTDDAIPATSQTFTTAARTVVHAPAVNTVAPDASGGTGLGDVLSITNGIWAGAAGGAYSYQWQRDGVDISGATSSSYMIVLADDAADLRCVVTYANSGGAVSANSNAITVDDYAAPSVSASGNLSNRSLTITVDTLTGSPTSTASLTTLTLDGADVLGDETGSGPWIYTVPPSAGTQTVAWTVTASNAIGDGISSGSEVVAGDLAAPVITGVPTISGSENIGQTLTASAASVTGDPFPTRTWQWHNSVSGAISGATLATYTLQASDEGDTVYVVQTETNGIGAGHGAIRKHRDHRSKPRHVG